MVSNDKTYKLDKFFAFIIGLLSVTNAVYVFVIGSTPIHPLIIVALIYLLYLVASGRMKLSIIKKYITIDIWLLFFTIILSVFSVIFSDYYNIKQWAVGVISIILLSFIVLAVLYEGRAKDNLYYGLIFGIFLNAIFCVVDFIFREKGIVISLKSLFPASNIAPAVLSNPYAAKGFFLEQGHLMRFLAIFFLPVLRFAEKKSKILYYMLFFSMMLMMVMTKSASIAIFTIGYLGYLIYNLKKTYKKLIALIAFELVFLICSNFIAPLKNLILSFTEGMNDITDSENHGNIVRISGFNYTLNIIKEYPIFGTGWNTLSKMFMSHGYYGEDNVFGSYSAALSLVAELGVFSLLYFYFILSKSFKLIKTKDTEYVAFGFAILIYFAIFCATDFGFDAGTSVFIGLILLNNKDCAEKETAKEKNYARGIRYDYNKNTI